MEFASVFTFALLSVAGPACACGEMKDAVAANVEMVKTAFGQAGDPSLTARTVEVGMADAMRFAPQDIAVRQGETIRFVARNRGKIMRELMLGTDRELREHAAMMRKHPGMEHGAPNLAHVGPGQRAEIVWRFTEVGEFKLAYLIPGRFEAGMAGTIRVTAR